VKKSHLEVLGEAWEFLMFDTSIEAANRRDCYTDAMRLLRSGSVTSFVVDAYEDASTLLGTR
jgi:hypothetical protein